MIIGKLFYRSINEHLLGMTVFFNISKSKRFVPRDSDSLLIFFRSNNKKNFPLIKPSPVYILFKSLIKDSINLAAILYRLETPVMVN